MGNFHLHTMRKTKNIRKFINSAIRDEKIDRIKTYMKHLNNKLGVIQREGYVNISKNYQRISDFLRSNPEITKINDKGEFRFNNKYLKDLDTNEIDRFLMALDGMNEWNLSTKILNPKNNYVNEIMRELYGKNAKQYSQQELGSIEEVMKIARTLQAQNDDFDLLAFDSDAVSMWAANNYNRSPESVINELKRISKLPPAEWIEALQDSVYNN